MKTIQLSTMKFAHALLTAALFAVLVAGCGNSGDPETAGGSGDAAEGGNDNVMIEGMDASGLSGKGESIRLEFRLKKGDVFGYKIRTVEDVNLVQDSTASHNRNELEYGYKFEVLETDQAGGGTLRATCTYVKFNGEYESAGQQQKMEYDSRKQNPRETQKLYAQYNAPVNTPYEFVINGQGMITAVNSSDDILKRLLFDDFNTTSFETKQMLKQEYNSNGLKSVIQLAFQRVPNGMVESDSTWDYNWEGSIGFLKISNQAVYALKGYEESGGDRIAHIHALLKTTYTGPRKIDTGEGMANIETFNVGGKGLAKFNASTGKPVSRRTKQTVEAKFFVEVPEDLKAADPNAHDFWLSQSAVVENDISPLEF